MLNMTIFAERLSEMMFDANLSAQKMADILSIDRTSVNKYLCAKRLPSATVLIRLANYFNCSIDYILGLENEYYISARKECPPFRERLTYLLQKKNKTKADLQRKTLIRESTIYNWLRGDFYPDADNLYKLSKYFDCSIDAVLGRTES